MNQHLSALVFIVTQVQYFLEAGRAGRGAVRTYKTVMSFGDALSKLVT